MEIEKPGKFTRYKGKLVIWQKGYESNKRIRVWAKLEYAYVDLQKDKKLRT